MKTKQYYAQIYSGDCKSINALPLILIAENAACTKEPQAIININDVSYPLISDIDIKTEKIIGYLSAEKKQRVRRKNKQGDIAKIANKNNFSIVTKKPSGKIIGYLKINSGGYIAVTRPNYIVPIMLMPLIFVVIMLLFHLLFVPNSPKANTTDIPINGELTPTITQQLDPAYFNIKVNATPIIKDNSMNIRIENSDRNKYICVASIEMQIDNEIKTIYISPQLSPNQALEFASIETNFPQGVYDGNAKFEFFDNDGKLIALPPTVEFQPTLKNSKTALRHSRHITPIKSWQILNGRWVVYSLMKG